MANKQKNIKPKPIGKQTNEKTQLIHPKHKSTIWTIVILIILVIFFIINNTREVPEEGPYPPNYKSQKTSEQ
jgi:hypothetical protein